MDQPGTRTYVTAFYIGHIGSDMGHDFSIGNAWGSAFLPKNGSTVVETAYLTFCFSKLGYSSGSYCKFEGVAS